MRDQQHRRPFVLEDRERLVAHIVAEPVVEAGERLVHQHDPRLRRQRPGKSHALLLATGELMRVLALVAGQADPAEIGLDDPGSVARTFAQTKRDILRHVQMRKQRKVLKHQTDGTRFGRLMHCIVGDNRAIDRDTARLLAFHARGDPQGRCLAAARWAQKADDFTRANVEAQFVHRHDIVERAAQPLQGQARIRPLGCCFYGRHRRGSPLLRVYYSDFTDS